MDTKTMTTISMVEAKKLRPHPKNPRKNLGDLTELTESIKQNGIMQNLTAVPDPDKDDGYMIIIGHRRFAAGKKAGLKEFPVSIICLDEADQVKLMLCENIQRSDLTAVEQAEGFQMMIDFGISVQELSEETGFAPSTIYHRLNIAKLDKAALEKTMDQLTLTDLIELEKIEDIETRNDILRKANRQTFSQMVQIAVSDQKTKKNEKAFIERLKAAGLTERPGRSWDHDVGNSKFVHISPGYDGHDIEVEEYEHFTKNEYGSGFLLYAMKAETNGEADNEKDPLAEKIDDLRGVITQAKEELDGRVFDIVDIAEAFAETVSKGSYVKDKSDEFIVECFMMDIIDMAGFIPSDAFDPEDYGLENIRCYEGTDEEWREKLEAGVRKRYGSDPTEYAAHILTYNMRGKHVTSGYTDGVLRGISEFFNKESAESLDRAIKALELIGFSLDDKLKECLKGDNEIVKRAEKAQADYKALIMRQKEAD